MHADGRDPRHDHAAAHAVIRPFDNDDLNAVLSAVEVVAAEKRWIGTEAPVDRERWTNHIKKDFESGGIHLVVDVRGAIVGCAGLRQVIPGLFELGMLLLPEWRGKGLGSRLLAEAVSWARDHDAYKLTLQVWPHNEAALALYEGFGFRREGLLRKHWRRRSGELWDAVVMGLLLVDEG